MTVPTIIFDFDGTLVQSLETVVTIINRLAPEFGYRSSSPQEIARLREVGTREAMLQVGLPWYKLPFVTRRLRAEMNEEIHRLQLVDGIKEVLQQLRAQGYRLGIITSNAEKNVQSCLHNHQLDRCFDFVESEFNLFGKARTIKKAIAKYRLDRQTVIYVGDEARDMQAARKIRVVAIAVAWGFHSRELLAASSPDYLIESPMELVEIMQELTLLQKTQHFPLS
ncbi:HAD-IA family hydrolase [Roseofilum casamattae]|uniref:HAD-IA family hydrolase n=1 Tax=Roseofilum casamattae BLCC-M143 TaxID=3022442 RepID=A0ABT7BUA4_9CYAN|nr:HAD-IA family hydrolase [Roseofilum casamattae]MDJ1182775.1 HAD-IA family hydrolase [Roseofilum casamattae BLCC-M143]